MATAVDSCPMTDRLADGASAGTAARLAPLVVAYLVYLPLAVVVTLLSRHQLNVDGVAYLRIARYYAEGRFDLAVTGYWAPLMSWVLVPFHWAGVDLVLVGHLVNVAAGAVFILAVHRLSRGLGLHGPVDLVLPLAAGLLVVNWLGRGLTPDALLASVLTLYFARNYAMTRSWRTRDAALAGGLAGLAYMVKYYALPFFLLHHLLVSAGLGRCDVAGRPSLARVRCWLTGTVVCLLIAGPWIVVLSCKYGRPTFATTGAYAHSLAGPQTPVDGYWPHYLLGSPRPRRVSVWENPDEIVHPWPRWSPFKNVSGMGYQCRLFLRNVQEISQCLLAYDGLGFLYFVVLAAVPLAGFSLRNPWSINPQPWRWLLVAIGAYLSGLIMVCADSRRYYWPLQGILLVFVGIGADGIARALARRSPESVPASRSWFLIAALAVLVSCGIPDLDRLRDSLNRPGLALAHAAQGLAAAGVVGPFATNHWHNGVVLAYRLDTPFVGVPRPALVAGLKKDLRSVGARAFLIFENDSYPQGAKQLEKLSLAFGTPSNVISTGVFRLRVYDLHREQAMTEKRPLTTPIDH